MQSHKKWRGGFTLVEILAVLAIVAIISSISFGAFRSVSEGNKRTTCQSNLAQIYKSARLYSQDYDGRFPYLNASTAVNPPNTMPDETPPGGIGLWALYAYPTDPTRLVTENNFTDYSSDLNLPLASEDGNQLAGYVRSAKIFHCPADRFDKQIQLRTPANTIERPTLPTASFTAKVDGVDATYINPAFLSYQHRSDTDPVDTYSSFRQAGAGVRQLTPYISTGGVNRILEQPTKDMTVLTWCRFHRSLDKNGNTNPGKRNFDNVLFSDGSVQSLPAVQDVKTETETVSTVTCSTWQRVPRDKAENMASTTNCTPSP